MPVINEHCCKYHLFGHCKFANTCQRFHVTNTCLDFPCLTESCKARHPRVCKFFAQFGKCKFNESCSYLHIPNLDKSTKFEKEINVLKEEIKTLKVKNVLLESLVVKMKNIEEEVQALKSTNIQHQGNEKTEDLVYSCDMCEVKCESKDKLKQHKELFHEKKESSFKCDLCDYESMSRKGVNIHKGSKHKPSKTAYKSSIYIPCAREVFGCKNVVT